MAVEGVLVLFCARDLFMRGDGLRRFPSEYATADRLSHRSGSDPSLLNAPNFTPPLISPLSKKRRLAHVFHPASDDQAGITALDMDRPLGNTFHAATADHIQGVSRLLHRYPRPQRNLTRRPHPPARQRGRCRRSLRQSTPGQSRPAAGCGGR